MVCIDALINSNENNKMNAGFCMLSRICDGTHL